jgi:TRAP-type C4-dicarboxylate transport system permease large subunit
VGVKLFVLAAVTRNDVPLAAIARAVVPYRIALLVAGALMMAFPIIALLLPQRFS